MVASNLDEAIEQVYEAFATYVRKPRRIEGSVETTGPDAPFFLAPLRALDIASLSIVESRGITTWGGPSDYFQFLPRILELASEAGDGSGIELCFTKLSLVELRANERAALSAFLDALWRHAVTSYRGYRRADLLLGTLRAAASFGKSGKALLDVWDGVMLDPGARDAVRDLARCLCQEPSSTEMDPLIEWITTGDRPSAACDGQGDEMLACFEQLRARARWNES